MNKRNLGLVAFICSVLFSVPAWSAQLALVIGNDAYRNVPKLNRAGGDAQAVGAALQSLGYSVTVARDLDYRGMVHALADFSAKIQPGDSVVFQFSGHGVAIEGRNYLLPVDVEQPEAGAAAAVEALSFEAGRITEQLARNKPKLIFAILDACRNNPFATSGRSVGSGRGLARMDVDPGEFILFSAGPGEEALDRLGEDDHDGTSVFTRVLLRSLSLPGITLQRLAKATQVGVRQLASTIHHEQFPDYFDRTLDEPVLLPTPAGAVPTAAEPQCSSPFLGRWANVDSRSRELDHLVISGGCDGGRGGLAMEVFGRCTPTPCPWGVRPAAAGVAGGGLSGHFDFSFATKDVSATLISGHRLRVTTATRYVDASGRKPRTNSDEFEIAPAGRP